MTEFGLYKLLLKSNKPVAKIFQKWVFNIIKEIRETSKYELKNTIEIERKLNGSILLDACKTNEPQNGFIWKFVD